MRGWEVEQDQVAIKYRSGFYTVAVGCEGCGNKLVRVRGSRLREVTRKEAHFLPLNQTHPDASASPRRAPAECVSQGWSRVSLLPQRETGPRRGRGEGKRVVRVRHQDPLVHPLKRCSKHC